MRVRYLLLLLALCLGAAHAVSADVLFTLDSYEYDSGAGVWEYTYAVDNHAGSGYVYDLFLGNIDQATILASPTGWDTVFGDTSVGGFASWTALDELDWLAPGAAPLSGFVLSSPYAPGSFASRELASDSDGHATTTDDTLVGSGGADGPTSQPEPGSLCLLVLAVGPALAWHRRRKMRASKADGAPSV